MNKHLFKQILKEEQRKPYFKKIIERVEEAGPSLSPDYQDIFRAFYITPLEETKVVILGQAPYPKGANGMAFAKVRGPYPGTARRLMEELKREGHTINHFNLTSWARQGVLLLNASLTVEQRGLRMHAPLSHAKLWEPFVGRIIKELTARGDVVFALLGKKAQALYDAHTADPELLTVRVPHPSPQSTTLFPGCGLFSLLDAAIDKAGHPAINWSLDRPAPRGVWTNYDRKYFELFDPEVTPLVTAEGSHEKTDLAELYL